MQTTNKFINTTHQQNNRVSQLSQTHAASKLEAATKLILSLIFLLLFAGFVYGASQWALALEKFTPSFFDLLLLACHYAPGAIGGIQSGYGTCACSVCRNAAR